MESGARTWSGYWRRRHAPRRHRGRTRATGEPRRRARSFSSGTGAGWADTTGATPQYVGLTRVQLEHSSQATGGSGAAEAGEGVGGAPFGGGSEDGAGALLRGVRSGERDERRAVGQHSASKFGLIWRTVVAHEIFVFRSQRRTDGYTHLPLRPQQGCM